MGNATKVAILLAVGGTAAFTITLWARGSSQSPPPQTPEEKALATARAFIETAAVPVQPTAEVRVQRRSYEVLGERPWNVTWGGQARVVVDPQGNVVRSFHNDWRILLQAKGLERTGRSIFKGEADARTYLWKLARAIGVPEDARMAGVRIYGDNTLGHGDANRAGSVGATFVVDRFGYPFIYCGPGMALAVDPQDGVLVHYSASWDNVTMPAERPAPPSVAREQAGKLATQVYLQHRKPHRRRASSPTSARLGWVVPNSGFGSAHRRGLTQPWPVRLAWVVNFGAEPVFIDPYDGSVLGGLEMRGVKQNPPADLAGRTGRVRRLK